jgi:hypothetical protein
MAGSTHCFNSSEKTISIANTLAFAPCLKDTAQRESQFLVAPRSFPWTRSKEMT